MPPSRRCPRSTDPCSCSTSWRVTITSRSAVCSAFRVGHPKHDCHRRARSFGWRCASSRESGPMPDDSKFDEFLRRETNRHMEHVTPPADAMWAAIERDVARAIQPPAPASRRLWISVGVGIAATLLIGVGLGRWSMSPETPHPVAASLPSSDDSATAAVLARASVVQYLGEAEIFLTAVRADLKAGRRDADRAERSRQLLARTRLLLASDEPRSPTVDLLLRDLELLLAEISALPDSGRGLDERLVD